MTPALSLTIQHNIHLTREERYALHEGDEITTIGVSLPVWFYGKLTSEPAVEVFCIYQLKNPKKDMPIQILSNGYEITLPFREGIDLKISDEEWRDLSLNNPDRLEGLYKQTVTEISSKSLLDLRDGGSEHLMYREHNKVKKGDEILSIMHFVCMGTMENAAPTMQSV